MSAKFTSHLKSFRQKHEWAVEGGLIAAAQVALNRVKRDLRGGYTSGDFTTGQSVSAARYSNVYIENGVPTIRLGTPLLYNLFWELGHFNLFTGKFERKEVWMPAMVETRVAQARAFARAYKQRMNS